MPRAADTAPPHTGRTPPEDGRAAFVFPGPEEPSAAVPGQRHPHLGWHRPGAMRVPPDETARLVGARLAIYGERAPHDWVSHVQAMATRMRPS
jgi:hypothetical protein